MPRNRGYAHAATWSGTIRLFRLGSQLAIEAGGRRQERERSRSGADDTPVLSGGTSRRAAHPDTRPSGGAHPNITCRRPHQAPAPEAAGLAAEARRPTRGAPRRCRQFWGPAGQRKIGANPGAIVLLSVTIAVMDQLVCMRSFMRVADLHSFTRAADALRISRAVVSTHVADLERHLRCQLFHRTTRRVGLTTDGAEYLGRCRRILADLEAADEALRGTRLKPQGRLRVDVPMAFGRALLTPALPRFQARYPDLQLEVQFNDRRIDLIAEEVDLVVRVGAVREPQLSARRVGTP